MSLSGIAMSLRGASSRLPDMFRDAAINGNVRHLDTSIDHEGRAIGETLACDKPSGGSGQ